MAIQLNEKTSLICHDKINEEVENSGVKQPEESCMVCRRIVRLADSKDIQVQPGDHIQTPMCCRMNCLGKFCMKHHAIVQEVIPIEGDHESAKIKVIDVPTKGGIFPCCSPFSIGKHLLRNEEKTPKKAIEIVLYKTRTDHQARTLKLAEMAYEVNKARENSKKVNTDTKTILTENNTFLAESKANTKKNMTDPEEMVPVTDEINDKGCICCPWENRYCLCVLNCEHFAVGMVMKGMISQVDESKSSTKASPIEVQKATCLQSARCFWFSFHIFMALGQGFLYGFNFYLYAIYAQHNENYNHIFNNSTTADLKWCYTGCDVYGFTTRCDWICFGVILLLYIICFCILLCVQRCSRKGFVCQSCILSARIIYVTKIICFIVIQLGNIFLERYLYQMLECINLGPWFTWLVIVLLSLLELIVLFIIVPHIIVKHCIIRFCWKCCDERYGFDDESFKYVIHHA